MAISTVFHYIFSDYSLDHATEQLMRYASLLFHDCPLRNEAQRCWTGASTWPNTEAIQYSYTKSLSCGRALTGLQMMSPTTKLMQLELHQVFVSRVCSFRISLPSEGSGNRLGGMCFSHHRSLIVVCVFHSHG